MRKHKVAEGDTVEAIARRFGLEPSSILWSNRMDPDTLLQIDQELVIPAADGFVHEVTEGDSFWEIAWAYEVDVEEIIRANSDISPDTLKPGDQLLIPGGTPPRLSTMVASRSGLEGKRSLPETAAAPAHSLPAGQPAWSGR